VPNLLVTVREEDIKINFWKWFRDLQWYLIDSGLGLWQDIYSRIFIAMLNLWARIQRVSWIPGTHVMFNTEIIKHNFRSSNFIPLSITEFAFNVMTLQATDTEVRKAMMQFATNIWLTKQTYVNHEYYFKLSIFSVASKLKNEITAHIFCFGFW
jgi:hypothetical protein